VDLGDGAAFHPEADTEVATGAAGVASILTRSKAIHLLSSNVPEATSNLTLLGSHLSTGSMTGWSCGDVSFGRAGGGQQALDARH
jgi:hypothetical protein